MQRKDIRREDFVAEIKLFKIKNKLKLKDLFTENDKTLNLRKDFFTNPTIFSYLSRDSAKVKFLQNRPGLIDANDKENREEKTNSDYYELRIYKLDPKIALYRDEIQSDNFYKSGTNHSANLFFDMRNKTCSNNRNIFTQENADVSTIRHLLNWYEYGEKLKLKPWVLKELEPLEQVRFALSPNWQDHHAMSMLHILDQQNRRILVTIFINSRIKEEETAWVKSRFNSNSFYSYSVNDATLETLKNEYKPELYQDEQIFIHSNQKVGVRLKGSLFASDQYSNLINNPDIDLIYDIDNKSLGNEIVIKRQIPFIDASHDLQLQDEDNNCVLYSSNFIEAISKMIEDKTIADSIYFLAQKIDQGDPHARISLALFFSENLKFYLPCYYEANGNMKTYDKIKEFHLKQRWDIGNEKLRYDILSP